MYQKAPKSGKFFEVFELKIATSHKHLMATFRFSLEIKYTDSVYHTARATEIRLPSAWHSMLPIGRGCRDLQTARLPPPHFFKILPEG